MLKAALLSFALAFAATALPAAGHAAPLSGGVERMSDDVSAARKSKQRVHRRAHVRHGRRVYRRAAPAVGATPQQQGANVCGGDARRLCRSVLGQGDFAVLQCFQARARYLSRGCRALLQSYGQI